MHQQAPHPAALFRLVEQLTYKPGWVFTLGDMERGQDCRGLTLVIKAHVLDSYDTASTIVVWHYMPVPSAAYGEQAWRRWLLDQILAVELHEAMEYFKIGGERPYAPVHAPGFDPYRIAELATGEQRRTDYLGNLNPA